MRRRLDGGGAMNAQLAAMLANSRRPPVNNLIEQMAALGAQYIEQNREDRQRAENAPKLAESLGLLSGSQGYTQGLPDGGNIKWNAAPPNLAAALAAAPDDPEFQQQLVDMDTKRKATEQQYAREDMRDERNFSQQKELQNMGLAKQLALLEREAALRGPEKQEKPETIQTAEGVFVLNRDGTLGNRLGSPVKSGMAGGVDPETGQPQRKLSATEQREFYEAQDAASSAGEALAILKQAKGLKDEGIYSGLGSGAMAAASRLPVVGIPFDEKKGARTTAYNNLLKEQAYSRLRATFSGGNITEGERASLERLQAISDYTPEEQDAILSEASNILARAEARARDKQAGISSGNIYRAASAKPQDAAPVDDKRLRLEALRAKKAGGAP